MPNYTVGAGDSASSVASKIYGDPRMFAALKAANPGAWYPGRVLSLPSKQKNPFVSQESFNAAKSGTPVSAGTQARTEAQKLARELSGIGNTNVMAAAASDDAAMSQALGDIKKPQTFASASKVASLYGASRLTRAARLYRASETASVAPEQARASILALGNQIYRQSETSSVPTANALLGLQTRDEERGRIATALQTASTGRRTAGAASQPLVRPGSPLERGLTAATQVIQMAKIAGGRLQASTELNMTREYVEQRLSPYEVAQGGQGTAAGVNPATSPMMQVADGQWVQRASLTEADMWEMWNPSAKAVVERELQREHNIAATGSIYAHEEATTPASSVPGYSTPAEKYAEIARNWAIENNDYIKVAHGNIARQFIGYTNAMVRGDFEAAANIMPQAMGNQDMSILYNWPEAKKYADAHGLTDVGQFAYGLGYDWDQMSQYGLGLWIKAGFRAPVVPSYGPALMSGGGGGGGGGGGRQNLEPWNWSIRIT